MRVWEAIEMLQGMDQNKEVTVTMGKPRKNKDEPFFQYPQYVQPDWVIGKENWPHRGYEVTCKASDQRYMQ